MESSTTASQASAMSADDRRYPKEPVSFMMNSMDAGGSRNKGSVSAIPRNKQDGKKPVQRLGRFWNKSCESWKAVTRALSLSLVVHAFQGLRHPLGRGLHEPTKIAIRQSRLIALLRNLVHLLPFGFALFEIILNWNVDLAIGSGLPFGLLFSGLQISQISYLWSVEFWGAMKANFQRPLRKVALFALVIGGIILAVASGPSSALLLIPRIHSWPAGRTHIWVNGTVDQIWPKHEWYIIRDWLSAEGQTPTPSYIMRFHGRTSSPLSASLQGKNAVRQLVCKTKENYIDEGLQPIVATTQQAVVSDALVGTSALWTESLRNIAAGTGHGSPLSDQSDAFHAIAENYSQPYSTVACMPGAVKNVSDYTPVALPLLPGANSPNLATGSQTCEGFNAFRTIRHPKLFYHQLSETPGNVHDYRIRWIDLPPDLFNGSSIGAAIILPESEIFYGSNLLLCNIAAGWGSSSLAVETFNNGFGPVNSRLRHARMVGKRRTLPITVTSSPDAETAAISKLIAFSYPFFPDQPINISESWAQYLNPLIEGSNTSVVNTIMQQPVIPDSEGSVAPSMLASLVANGLARTSWQSVLQGNIRTVGLNGKEFPDGNFWLSGKGDVFEVDPAESQDWVTFRVDSTLEGYAYNTLTTPPQIAIAVLMAYCFLVVGHVLYSGITGISSNCWDTIAEVTALAINSTPTAALRNTCAGISELHIFKLPVRVLVSKDKEGEGEHLELVFGKADKKKIEERTIKANRTYGTLPRGLEGKKDV
ncbi:MAG: hypothetical protein Q9225_005104 [Loekoesia sp. 1 TL-2023]